MRSLAPSPRSASCAGLSAPEANSAKIVALGAEVGTFPAATPPSLTISRDFNSLSLPIPTTTSLGSVRPEGATMSRLEPIFPVKRSAAAARRRRSPIGASAFCVAGPNWRFSSQNTTRTPRGRAKLVKPNLRAAGINRSFAARRRAERALCGVYEPERDILQSPRFGAKSRRRRPRFIQTGVLTL